MSSGQLMEGMNGTFVKGIFWNLVRGLQASSVHDEPKGCDGEFRLSTAQPLGEEVFSGGRTSEDDFAAELFSFAEEILRDASFADSSLAMLT